jgi:poly(A) polymerase
MPPHAKGTTLAESPERALALRCIASLRSAGFVALLAGGCVRDELLGNTPSDYDIATSATPDTLAKLFPRTAHVGAHFGVVLVREGPHTIEVATFRSDGTYSDGRRPDSVQFSTPEQDAQRRDFTVNALFLDPFSPQSEQASEQGSSLAPAHLFASAVAHRCAAGTIIDFVGGLPDLSARVLRAVGDPHARLQEDHLRALRAVRLSAKLGFEIHPTTKLAITRHAMDLRGVSPERIGDECRAMLQHPARARSAALLAELGLIPAMLGTPSRGSTPREPVLLASCAASGEGAGMALATIAWAHSLGVRLLPSESGSDPAQFIASARAGLCLSNDETTSMTHLVARLAQLDEQWEGAPVARRKRIASSREWAGALHLFGVLRPDRARAVRDDVEHLARTFGGLQPAPLLTGDHLLAAGFRGGPKFKVALDAAYDAQLEGRVTTQGEAFAFAKPLLSEA